MSFIERAYLIQLIQEKNEATKKAIEEAKAKAAASK
jgi:hypothetical protein